LKWWRIEERNEGREKRKGDRDETRRIRGFLSRFDDDPIFSYACIHA
jgi:hypothetical protein